MWPTWRTAPLARASAASCSASASVPAIGFSTMRGDAPGQEGAGDLAVHDRRHGDRDGVHRRPGARGSRPGPPCGTARRRRPPGRLGVGDADELDAGHRCQDPGMVLAQVPDPDDAHSQPSASCLPPAFPRPALLAEVLGLDEIEQALHLRAEVPVRLEDLGGCAAVILAR